jgi:hypothetical protein
MLPFADFIKEYAVKLKIFIDELVSMPQSSKYILHRLIS